MRYVFGLIGVACILASVGTCTAAKSSIHETLGVVIFLAGVVALAAGAVLGELAAIHHTLKGQPSERQKLVVPTIKD